METEVEIEQTFQEPTQQPDPPRKKLWNSLREKQLYTKSYEDFDKQFSSNESIDKLHKVLSEKQLYTKTTDDFKSQFFSDTQPPVLKKKVGSVIFPEDTNSLLQSVGVGSEGIPTIEMYTTPSGEMVEANPIALSKKYKELSDKMTTGFGGELGRQSVPDEEARKSAKKLQEDFKDLDLGGIYEETKDIPDEVLNQYKDDLMKDRVDNNPVYQRKIARLKWQPELNKSINNYIDSGFLDENEANEIKQSIQSSLDNSEVGNYDQQRANAASVANAIKKFGGEKADNILKNYATEISKVYGNSYKTGGVKSPEGSPESTYLNDDAQLGLQYIKDLSPEQAGQYDRLMIDPKTLKDNPDAQKGYNHLMQTLEETGIGLTQNAVTEDLNNLKNIATEQGGLSPEQIEQAKVLEAKQEELTQKRNELDKKYPDRIENKVNSAVNEVMGNELNWGEYALGKTGQAITNTVRGIWEGVSEPFMSDASNTMRELSIMGESIGDENMFKQPEKNRPLLTDKFVMEPDLQKQVDGIKNNSLLNSSQKRQKLQELFAANTDKFGRVPIKGGQLNVNPSSIVYGLTDLGATLLPFIALESVTGGGATAGASRKFMSTFTAAAATSFHDEYASALLSGKSQSEAYKEAMGITAINSLVMAGASTPEKIKAMLNPKTSAGKLILSMSDEAIEKVLQKGTPKGLKAIKQSFTERAKAIPKQFAGGLKTGAEFEVAMNLANEAKAAIYDTEIDREQNFKQSLLGIANFGIMGAGLGQAGFKSPSELQKSSLLKFGENPKEYISVLDGLKKDGKVTPAEYDHRKALIESSEAAYKKLPQSLNEKQKSDYLYQTVIRDEALKGKSDLPPKQAAAAEKTALVADHTRGLILEPPTDKQLNDRIGVLERKLEPKKDAEGKAIEIPEKEKLDMESELEALTNESDTRKSFDKVEMIRRDLGSQAKPKNAYTEQYEKALSNPELREDALKEISDQWHDTRSRKLIEESITPEIIKEAKEKYPQEENSGLEIPTHTEQSGKENIVNKNERTEWNGYKVGDVIDGSELYNLSGKLENGKEGDKYVLVQESTDKFYDKREDNYTGEDDYNESVDKKIERIKKELDQTPPIPEDGDGWHRIVAAKELGRKTVLMWKKESEQSTQKQQSGKDVVVDEGVVDKPTLEVIGEDARKAMSKEIESQVSAKENSLIEKQKQDIEKAKNDLAAINGGDKSVIDDYVKKSGYKLVTKEVIANNPKSELLKKSEGKYYTSNGASIQVKTAEQIAIDGATKKANSKPTGSNAGSNQYVDAYNAITKFSKGEITAEEAKNIIEKAGLKIPKAIEQSLSTKPEIKNEEAKATEDTKSTEKVSDTKAELSEDVSEAAGGKKEPPKEPTEPVGEEGGEMGGITQAANAVRRMDRQMSEFEKIPQSFEQWNNEAEAALKKGYDVDALMDRLEKNPTAATPVENAIRKIYIATLDAEIAKNPTDALLAKQKRFIEIGDAANRIAGQQLVSLRGQGNPLSTISDFYVAKMEAAGVDKLTEQQKKETKESFENVQKADENANAAMELYREEIAKLKAENELLKQKKEPKPKVSKPKTKEDFVSERKSLKDKLKEQFDEYKNSLNKVGIKDDPIEGFVITVKMAKTIGEIAKSHVEEVGVNLKEVTLRTFNEIKDVLKGVTEKDIHDVLAGEYRDKKPTRNELAAKMRDLKDEAYYINKLERLLKGTEPKSEKEKVKRNQQITELQKKIKEFYKAEREAAKEPKEEVDIDLKKLESIKKRNETENAKIKERIAKGDFETKKPIPFLEDPAMQKKFPKEYNAALDAIKAREDARHEFDIALLRDQMARRTFAEKATDNLSKGLGTVKAITTGIDDSAVAIQTYVSMLVRPRTGVKAFYQHIRQGVSQKKFDRWLSALHASSDYKEMREMGLDVTEPSSLKEREKEEIFNNRFSGTVKIKGKEYKLLDAPLKPFERAFTTLGNVTRVVGYRTISAKYKREGYTSEKNPELFKSLAKRLNTETGRGEVNEYVNNANKVITMGIWSPKLMAQKFNILGVSDLASLFLSKAGTKGYYRQLHPKERAAAIIDVAQFATTVMALSYGFALAFGGDVDNDPLSSTFMDIKLDNGKSYNFTGGFSGYIRAISQFAMGEKHKNGQSKDANRLETAGRFFRGKTPPVTSAALNLASGKNFMGQPTTVGGELVNLAPISLRGIVDQIKKDGAESFFTQGIPTFFGLNVKNEKDYEDTSSKKPKKPSKEKKPQKQ